MFVGANGIIYEYTDVTEKGDILYHHGCKALTEEQTKRFNKIISSCWDSLSLEKKLEVNKEQKK